MAAPKSNRDDTLLKNLVPLNTLSDEQFEGFRRQIITEKVKKGEYLFREGDTDHLTIYLLSGTVALLAGQKEVDSVSSGSQTARFALAHQIPRKYSARAKGSVTYVRVDSRQLSDLLARSQSASYEVNEAGISSMGDWMSQLLQSPVFQQIPPANLQQVMMRMQEVPVVAGEVIIQQGDEGDYFYLISKGSCKVTRHPAPDYPPVELAQLTEGQGFGEEALISDKPRGSTVTMLTDGELVRLSKEDFVELVKQPVSNNIDYAQGSRMVEEDAIWIDVRTPEEYEAVHLEGAVNLPFFSLRFQAPNLAEDRRYLVYGADAGQAGTGVYLLMERGYEVYALMQDWEEIAAQAGLVADSAGASMDINSEIIKDKDKAVDEEPRKNESVTEKKQNDSAESSETNITELQSQVKLLKQALATAEEKLKNSKIFEDGQYEFDAQLKELRTALDLTRDTLKKAQEETDQAREARGQLERDLQIERNQRQQLEKKHQEELASLDKKLELSKKSLQGLKQQTVEQHDVDTKQIASLQAEVEALQETRAEASEYRKSVDQLTQELTSANNKIAELHVLQQRLENEKEGAETSQADALNEAILRAENAEEEVRALKKSQHSSQADYQQQIKELTGRLETADKQLQQNNDEFTTLRDGLRKFEQETEALKQERGQLTLTLQEAERIRDHLQHERAAIEANVQTSQESLTEAKNEIKALEELRKQLESSLEQEHQTAEFLRRSLETAEEAVEISAATVDDSNQEITDLKQQLQELQKEAEALHADKVEWEKSHQELLQDQEDELARLRHEHEQEMATQHVRSEQYQQEREGLQAENTHLESQLAEIQNSLTSKQQAFDSAITEQKEQIERLESELTAARADLERLSKEQVAGQDTKQALNRAEVEIAQLTKTIEGLREVQLEMESQLSGGGEEELHRLRVALESEEKKRRLAEESAKKADVLRREREVQEAAVEMLGEDIEKLSRENAKLLEEKEKMTQQIAELHGQPQGQPEEEMALQLEEWRSKAIVYESERDDALAVAARMEAEVKELRSVIETYVTQLQNITVMDSNDELEALRSELEMVRNQAAEELEKARNQLSASEGMVKRQGDRDMDTVTSLQALRQEIDSNQRALNEKDQLLRKSQSQCRNLEDAIEDRDKEIDHLRRRLESLLRKTGDWDKAQKASIRS